MSQHLSVPPSEGGQNSKALSYLPIILSDDRRINRYPYPGKNIYKAFPLDKVFDVDLNRLLDLPVVK